jgi:hypothetical protein
MTVAGYGSNALREITGTSNQSKGCKYNNQQQYRDDIAYQVIPDFKAKVFRQGEFLVAYFPWNFPGHEKAYEQGD